MPGLTARHAGLEHQERLHLIAGMINLTHSQQLSALGALLSILYEVSISEAVHGHLSYAMHVHAYVPGESAIWRPCSRSSLRSTRICLAAAAKTGRHQQCSEHSITALDCMG